MGLTGVQPRLGITRHRSPDLPPVSRGSTRRTTGTTAAAPDLRHDPVRREIFAALQQWHDPSAVSDAKVDEVRKLLKALPYEWRADTGNQIMPPGELRYLPINGGPAAVSADGWVHADFTEASGDFIRLFPRWLDNLVSRPKTYHLKFNIFESPLRVVPR